ncbi:MAG: DUF4198 domain-containing protein [Pseudomonadota bacterium]
MQRIIFLLRYCAFGGLALFLATTVAQAHEFWIEPLAFQVAAGEDIAADLKVGQNFVGSAYSYNPNRFRRFEMVTGDKTAPVPGTIGDRPAVRVLAEQDGLAILVHETTDNTLTYAEWQKFVDFVAHKDLVPGIEAHRARALPETGFRERYSRYAKSLVAVGEGKGADRQIGLLTEIVALTNPYDTPAGEGVKVQVLYQGAPRGQVQLEVFERAPSGDVTVRLLRTDDQGEATVPVQPGHDYMLDAVVMRELEGDVTEKEDVWESLWANLTFHVPN